MKLNQKGFSHVLVIILIAIVVGVAGYSVLRIVQSKESTYTAENAQAKAESNTVKIKSLPVELDDYDPATGRAGDVEFPAGGLSDESFDMIFFDYALTLSGENVAGGQDKTNPQPTFRVAAGTKVRSLVDGEVVDVPKLYSNDYSVHVRGNGSDLIFETEHIMDVTVKVGDKVKAGDILGVASDYDAHNIKGLGIIEIGVLQGGQSPTHLCTFDFLDDSIKSATLSKIDKLKKDWATFRGKPELYVEADIPGCVNHDPVVESIN